MAIEDETEGARRLMVPTVNTLGDDEIPPPTWTTEELQRDFEVLGFAAPFIVVRRKSDGVKGSLMFRHHPRVYFNFDADRR